MDLKEKVIFWNPRHHRRGPETNQGLMTAPPPLTDLGPGTDPGHSTQQPRVLRGSLE